MVPIVVHADSATPVRSSRQMVVTAQHLATQVGQDVLNQGGNAIDAAVAVGYALAVVHPCCGNIGGGGFLTLHLASGKETFFNFRERAPLAATPDMYLDEAGQVSAGLSTEGYRAVAVPGTVLGLEVARRRYGTMSRAALMAPAIRLAEAGFVLTAADVDILKRGTDSFRQQANIAAIFLRNGKPFKAGDRFVQKNLAKSLRLIAEAGPRAFYRGPLTKTMVRASQGSGGLLSAKDFRNYTVEENPPLRCSYRGYEIVSAPPPSSGGATLCLLLHILEAYPLAAWGVDDDRTIHYMIEAMRHAFYARNQLLGDPDFVKNPLPSLLSAAYAEKIRQQIHPKTATPSSQLESADLPGGKGTHTTHYSIVDRHGNAVAVTYTLNSYFGAKRIAGDTGFFLNNEMDDFAIQPGKPNQFGMVEGERNAIAPGKRPLSSMTPTLVKKDGRVYLVLGSPGGPRIITTVLTGILNVIDFDMGLAEAVARPRIHQQWMPDVVYVEPKALSRRTKQRLRQQGYRFEERKPWGAMEAIMIKGAEQIIGVNDPRRPGGAASGDLKNTETGTGSH